jgi:multiple sugar transport system permease protein
MIRWQRLMSKFLSWIVIGCLVFFAMFPFYWMINTSFKTHQEASRIPSTFVPEQFTVKGYIDGWNSRPFGRYFVNTLVVSLLTTITATALAILAGYGFSRFRIKGGPILLLLLLGVQMFPSAMLIVPYFISMRQLGILNTYWALVLAFSSFALPLCIWMLKAFFDTIPREIEESGLIDGCTRWQTLIKLILPLSRPGIGATVIYTFINAWKEYLFALTLATNQDMYVVSVGIAAFIGEHTTYWNEMMAMSIISILPVVILFVLLQRHLIAGLTAGAVKA